MTLPTPATALQFAIEHHSIVTSAELTTLGISENERRSLTRNGSIRKIGTGLYQCFDAEGPLVELRKATAFLPNSAAGFASARFLIDFDRRPPTRHEIVAPSRATSRSPFAKVRRTAHLPAFDIVTVQNLPCTSVARTVCDSIPEMSLKQSQELVAHALANCNVEPGEILACDAALASRGRGGVETRRIRLGEILTGLGEHDLTFLETTFTIRYDSLGLVELVPQFRPPWFDGWRGIVDFACIARKIIIELDGRSHRQRLADFENDRRRDRKAARHGYLVLRFTYEEIMHRWPEVAAELTAHFGIAKIGA